MIYFNFLNKSISLSSFAFALVSSRLSSAIRRSVDDDSCLVYVGIITFSGVSNTVLSFLFENEEVDDSRVLPKQVSQKTGFLPFGLNGTSHGFRHVSQMVLYMLCVCVGLAIVF